MTAAPEDSQTTTSLNAIEKSKQEHGDLSYYQGQRQEEDLSKAEKIAVPLRTGESAKQVPAVLNGGASDEAIVLDKEDPRYVERKVPDREVVSLNATFMFEENDDKVKIHIKFPEKEILETGKLETEFWERGLRVHCDLGKKSYRFLVKDQPLHAEIVPEKCKFRVSSDKMRLVLTLVKFEPDERWGRLLHKEMNQHTGWN